MKRMILLMFSMLLAGFVSAVLAAEVDPDGSGWQLIHENPQGTLLSMHSGSMVRSPEGFTRVWMKYETPAANSPSPMLFLNEFDCAGGLVRRLEVRLYRSTVAGSGEPFSTMTFDGKWDRPSEGIEKQLQEAVCQGEIKKSL